MNQFTCNYKSVMEEKHYPLRHKPQMKVVPNGDKGYADMAFTTAGFASRHRSQIQSPGQKLVVGEGLWEARIAVDRS